MPNIYRIFVIKYSLLLKIILSVIFLIGRRFTNEHIKIIMLLHVIKLANFLCYAMLVLQTDYVLNPYSLKFLFIVATIIKQ